MIFPVVKSSLVIISLITASLGLYSHLFSDWVKVVQVDIGLEFDLRFDVFIYQICDVWPPVDTNYTKVPEEVKNLSCPRISQETFFVTTILFSVFCSLFSLGHDFVWQGNPSGKFKFFDIIANLAFAALLLISSTIFIVDAKQINNLIAGMHNYPQFTKEFKDLGNESENGPFNIKQLYGTKITAAIFGIFQSLLHAVIVVNGFRGGRSTDSYEAH